MSLGTSWRVSRDSKLDVTMPGPMDFRGARAAGFGGAWAGSWLWRRVRMDMFVAGGGTEVDSGSGLLGATVFCFLDWLKRRMREVLRAGRASVPVPGVNASGPVLVRATACVAGIVVGNMETPPPPPPGAGKSLRSGS